MFVTRYECTAIVLTISAIVFINHTLSSLRKDMDILPVPRFMHVISAPPTVNTMPKPETPCLGPISVLDDWKATVAPDDIMTLDQSDSKLAEYICEKWLMPPPTVPRSLRNSTTVDYSQRGQSTSVDNLLNQRTDGFYIESGAADGETFSNTLFFEKSRNWRGILVEANPKMFSSLFSKHRQAHMINACLSPSQQPQALEFSLAHLLGGLNDFMDDSHVQRISNHTENSGVITVQCFPLAAILHAMKVTHVDYWSLDIEGAELSVLYTVPFDKITIDVLSIEYIIDSGNGINTNATLEKLKKLNEFLVDKHGYTVAQKDYTEDVIYIRNEAVGMAGS